jgi:osmoprotectant transport system permease protein
MPVILAGIRTATIWVVGIATLSTPIGQPSLGNYIFGGLQTRSWITVILGCVLAAALAIGLDLLIALLESGVRRRKPMRILASILALLLIFALSALPRVRGGEDPFIVGSKTFTEQYILSELIADALRDAELPAESRQSLGSTIAFDALRTGAIDAYVDYTGTIWANYMKRDGVVGAEQMLEEVSSWLQDEHEIRCLGALGFENAYALAMRRDRAEELGIQTIADLAQHAPQLRIGSDYEFFSRPEWTRLRDAYDLSFEERVGFDSTFMYQAVARGEVDVITAFSSDGRIAAFDLLVLEDTKQAFPPYDAVLLLSPRASANEVVVNALQPLIGSIDDEAMRQANMVVDVEGDSVGAAAAMLTPTAGQ